jgi:hypothetical protein
MSLRQQQDCQGRHHPARGRQVGWGCSDSGCESQPLRRDGPELGWEGAEDDNQEGMDENGS